MKNDLIAGLRALAAASAIGLAVVLTAAAVPSSAKADTQGASIPADKLEWAPFGKGPAKVAVLWGNMKSGEYAMLLKLPPGATPGPHGHTAAYHGINLQGVWVHIVGGDVKSLPPGSYVMQPGVEEHNDACAGPEECILFIHQHAPFDFLPPAGSSN